MHFRWNKSQVAFLLSAQMLFERYPESMYFWTFTFEKVYPDWWYAGIWKKFVDRLGDRLNRYGYGLRVIEPHEEHGLHYHLLLNRRLGCQEMARLWGHGRVSVCRCDFGAATYLAKYLCKDAPKMYGVYRWHTFGPWRGVKKNAIEIDSRYMRARREIATRTNRVMIGYEKLMESAFILHGKEGLRRCYNFLCDGKTTSACLCVSPNVEITARGGIRYLPFTQAIKLRVVRRT